jgi:glycosyltransferase involved in cell wall biosynthesis
LKVLVLTSSYPTPEQPVGGIFVQEYARAAADHADVVVAHLDRNGGTRVRTTTVDDDGLPLVRVQYPRSPAGLAWHLAAAETAWRRLPFEPDLIHAHFVVAGIPAVLLGRLHRKPVVISENWGIFLADNPDRVKLPLRIGARFAFGQAKLVLPVSEAMERALRQLGVRTDMRVLPNPVDERVFSPPTAREPYEVPHLVTVGLFYDGAKGIDLLLRAVAQLGRKVRLDIVGDGIERVEYERLAAELEIADVVTFRGLLPKPAVAELMRNADVFVLASRYDNNPNVLLEALMSGLPSVATTVGGVPELIDATNGILVAPHDVPALADGIRRVLERLESYDRALIAQGAAGRFGRERVATDLAAAFADVLAVTTAD